MLDVVENDYLDLGMPNVKAERSKRADPALVEIHTFMKPFILEVAKLFPMWELIGKRANWKVRLSGVEAVEFWRFDVYENREFLGTLEYEHSKNGYSYSITNSRIQNKRERGNAARTKDMKKALKILSKEFGIKKMQERVAEAQENCANALHNFYHDKNRSFNHAYSYVHTTVEKYVMSNWDTIKEIGLAKGADAKIIDNILSVYEEREIAAEFAKSFDTDGGVVVVIHGNDYAVKDKESISIYGTDNLPEWIKRGIGMLKLIDKKTAIANIGYKVDDQVFFVLKGAE